ncbi:MAG: type I-E CRISPR-associated protein Cas6/Cse3/CasE, partial [Candidatus Competibacteraceae bacterium]|nr:type I-E CRISPR-associated protein Cas6/Cse3/CasE [Candidatus Competibacteraceae bacterium]
FKKDGKAGKIATVGYTGMLEIIEPTTLNELLQKGIGPAKAFGCGLLLVRRI